MHGHEIILFIYLIIDLFPSEPFFITYHAIVYGKLKMFFAPMWYDWNCLFFTMCISDSGMMTTMRMIMMIHSGEHKFLFTYFTMFLLLFNACLHSLWHTNTNTNTHTSRPMHKSNFVMIKSTILSITYSIIYVCVCRQASIRVLLFFAFFAEFCGGVGYGVSFKLENNSEDWKNH